MATLNPALQEKANQGAEAQVMWQTLSGAIEAPAEDFEHNEGFWNSPTQCPSIPPSVSVSTPCN